MYGLGGYGEGPYGGPPSPEELSEDELNDSIEELRTRVRRLEESEANTNDRLQGIESGVEKLLRDDEVDTGAWIRFSVQIAVAVAIVEGVRIQPEALIVIAMFWLAYWSAPSQWER